MATEVVKTVGSGGEDYASIAAFLSGEARDLVSADEIAVAELSAETFSGAVTLDPTGWTLDTTRRIVIRPASGAHHAGVRGAGVILTSTDGTATLRFNAKFATLSGIEVINTGVGSSIAQTSIPSGASIRIEQCILESTGVSSSGNVANLSAANISILEFWSNLILGTGRALDARNAGAVSIFNNTAHVLGSHGILVDNADVIKNNAVLGTSTVDYYQGSASSNKNASEDGTAPGTNTQTISTSSFENTATDDYHPSSGSALLANGEDLSGTFTTDITGATRSGAWTIGAYQSVLGGSFLIPTTVWTL